MNEERMVEIAKKYLKLELTDDIGDKNVNIYCYPEPTADGYEIWVVTPNMENIVISENVFYYDSDVADAIIEQIEQNKDEKRVLYIEDHHWEEDFEMDEKMSEYVKENAQDIINDESLALTNEELEHLKGLL